MLPEGLVSSATVRYLGTSAQKARLVVNMIRGKDVGAASATLRYTKKAVASEIGRLLDSAVANARQKRQDVDVDRLFVQAAFVNGGPSLKRIQAAPMGRAFRILKRMCHVTIGLGEHRAPAAQRRATVAEGSAEAAAVGTKRRAGARGRKTAGRAKSASPAKKGRRAAERVAKKKG